MTYGRVITGHYAVKDYGIQIMNSKNNVPSAFIGLVVKIVTPTCFE